MAREITNYDDVIDSRDVIERVRELEDLNDLDEDEKEELADLKALEKEAEGSPDWEHGETLIRDSYFKEYAQELAEETGMLDRDAKWPMNCIDWEQAAQELKYDYFSVEFGGIDYWIRS